MTTVSSILNHVISKKRDNEKILQILAQWNTWNFDLFDLVEASRASVDGAIMDDNPQPLMLMGMTVFERHSDICAMYQIPEKVFVPYGLRFARVYMAFVLIAAVFVCVCVCVSAVVTPKAFRHSCLPLCVCVCVQRSAILSVRTIHPLAQFIRSHHSSVRTNCIIITGAPCVAAPRREDVLLRSGETKRVPH